MIDKFRNKTVMITGHTGFKGAWLSTWLSHLGAKVVGLSLNVPTNPSLFSSSGVESLVECPFNSSHMFVPEEVRMEAGVVPGFVRMSVGIEDVEDIWNDIEQALAVAADLLSTRA